MRVDAQFYQVQVLQAQSRYTYRCRLTTVTAWISSVKIDFKDIWMYTYEMMMLITVNQVIFGVIQVFCLEKRQYTYMKLCLLDHKRK